MKKLINAPETVVDDALAGVVAAHGDLVRVIEPNVVVRADAPKAGKVGVISGGGSGHEPMHGGFVGMGMLDAACPGAVFTSPVPDQMLAATKAVDGGAGVLHIVKNYTGDVMNFEMAAELAAAEGIAVESVVIDDDVSVQDSLYTAGRRGVGTTVLAEKICGAAAKEGRPLEEVAALCRKVNANGRSMGMALTSCTVPMAGRPTRARRRRDGDRHRHPRRTGARASWPWRARWRLWRRRCSTTSFTGDDEVLAFVNGMGGTRLRSRTRLRRADRLLAERVSASHATSPPHTTSLDMAYCSITLLRLDDEPAALWTPVRRRLRWGA
jgi:dihydroxyacetone kinase-like protein